MKARRKRKDPEIVMRRGKPRAVILGIEEYRELLERAEDAEDLKSLREMRKRQLKFRKFDDFLKERMKGRSPVNTRLDKQGHGSVVLAPGSWWLHAKISGDEEIEWRLPVTVIGPKQVIELTPQNAYTRSRTF